MKKVTEEELRNISVEFGKRGGNALVKKRGKKYMKELSKRATQARWGNKKDNK